MATMIYDSEVDAFHQSCVIMRTSDTNIDVYTRNRLTDDQMNDLYWICSFMTKIPEK